MFATIGRSWRFAKISYGIIWDYKNLIVFPLLSTAAGLVVLASFVAPLWGTGTLDQWMQMLGGEGNAAGAGTADQVLMYATILAAVFTAIGVGIVLIIIVGAATSAADVVFKALFYNHATGRSVPADIDRRVFAEAFRSR